MATTVDALRARNILGRKEWFPAEPYGPDGWCFGSVDMTRSIIASCAWMEGVEWIHASIAYSDHETMPTYDDLVLLHKAIFGEGYAYQVFTPPDEHVNIHETALHIWGRSDGKPVLPEFGDGGTI
jgi:hypothetical protein